MKKNTSMIQTDQSACEELDNYLFAGSDKVTILTNYPSSIAQEPNPFESQKRTIFGKIKDAITGWITSSSSDEGEAPDIKLKEGTYSCAGGTCIRIPGDEKIDYQRIKEVI